VTIVIRIRHRRGNEQFPSALVSMSEMRSNLPECLHFKTLLSSVQTLIRDGYTNGGRLSTTSLQSPTLRPGIKRIYDGSYSTESVEAGCGDTLTNVSHIEDCRYRRRAKTGPKHQRVYIGHQQV